MKQFIDKAFKYIKHPIGIGILVFVLILFIVFISGFSGILELIFFWIFVILGILLFLIGESDGIIPGICSILIAIGLVAWHNHNDSYRKQAEFDKQMLLDDQKREAEQRQDSINFIKKRNEIMIRQKRLYKEEGELIFGDFYFGMTENDFAVALNKIKKETNGLIRIGSYDFTINESRCYFIDNKLYQMQIDSDDGYEIYYDMEAHDYSERGKFEKYYVTNGIKDYLSKKYGTPTDENGFSWYFDYKTISIFEYTVNSIEDNSIQLKTYYKCVAVIFRKPSLEKIALQREDEEKQKQKQLEKEQKVREQREKDSINEKKKSFTKGI